MLLISPANNAVIRTVNAAAVVAVVPLHRLLLQHFCATDPLTPGILPPSATSTHSAPDIKAPGKFQNLDSKFVTFFDVLRHFSAHKGIFENRNRKLRSFWWFI